jgi:fructose 1,6-bisphosphate aldolase/phosphatase
VIKADIGSIGGHIRPSEKLIATVDFFVKKSNIIDSSYVFSVGDDIAIVMSHSKGKNNPKVHKLAWDAFMAGTEVAKEQGLYGAGQDLLKDAFSGNIKGAGPAVAEIEFEERPNEPFIVFLADKTDPGAYNLPLYLMFSDPMHNSGLILSDKISKGFKYKIMDVSNVDGDSIIELSTPENIYDIAALLRDNERFVVEGVYSRSSGAPAAAVSTTRLHNIAGKYTGKDDPVMVIRAQKDFPSAGELLSPFSLCHYVAGFMRGSHIGPLMPVKKNSIISYFDGPPVVSALGFCVQNRKLTEPVDLFDHPFWDTIRKKASEKAVAIREQGFSGSAMLGMNELEYNDSVVEKIKILEKRFEIKNG